MNPMEKSLNQKYMKDLLVKREDNNPILSSSGNASFQLARAVRFDILIYLEE